MMIDKINGINPINNLQNTRRVAETSSKMSAPDSINVSEEAKEAARVYYMNKVAEETPDVRADLVASVKEKIKDPNYLNSAIIGSTADKILESFGF